MKFRRKQSDPAARADGDDMQDTQPDPGQAPPGAGRSSRPQGPWDSAEVDLAGDDDARIDLGALLVTGGPGLELRLHMDEASQQIAAALLLGPDGAVELRPFAAPRNADIWEGVRKQLAAETARRGGTATAVDGPYGTELQVAMPVTTPEGQSATQPSRVLGISGPRWLLRATYLGKPALEPDPGGVIETALRSVVVVRGSAPMAPGDPLPLAMPANAQPIQPQQPEPGA